MTTPPAEPRPVTVALLGGARHKGHLRLGARLAHVTLLGGMDLDFTEAELPAGGVTVTKLSLLGGVSLVVPPGVRVEVSGFTLLGGKDVERRPDLPPDAPLVKVRAFGLLGGVRVRIAG